MIITSTKQAIESINALVYGESGCGKTVLCSTAPDPIIISSEKGLMSIAEFDIPVLEISSIEDLRLAYREVKKGKWLTVCLDSVSDIAETCLTDYKERTKDPRKAYGDLHSEISNYCRKFRDLRMNTVIIGKAVQNTDAAGQTSYGLSMPSKRLASDLPYMFDLVLAMRMQTIDGKVVRILQTTSSETYYAKDRSNTLKMYEEPDLTAIFKKVATKLKKKKKKDK